MGCSRRCFYEHCQALKKAIENKNIFYCQTRKAYEKETSSAGASNE